MAASPPLQVARTTSASSSVLTHSPEAQKAPVSITGVWNASGTNALIAASRSKIMASVGDCTRPTGSKAPYKQEVSLVMSIQTVQSTRAHIGPVHESPQDI